MTRVLHLSTYADKVGGAEVYCLGLVDGLREHGHDVALFGTSPDRSEDSATTCVVKRPVYSMRGLIEDDTVTTPLRTQLERFRPEIVHVHLLWALPLTVERVLADYGAPVVQTAHDFSVVCPNSWCVRGDGSPCPGGAGRQCFAHGCDANYPFAGHSVLATSIRARQLASLVGVTLCPSEALREMMASHGARDARRQPYFLPEAPDGVPPRDDRGRLAYVGRLDPAKGLVHLLDAIARVVERGVDARLDVIGDGPERASLETHARQRGIADRVAFHGKVAHEAVWAHAARAAALVIPSTWMENSPVTIYEAIQLGTPVVGSRIGGIPDYVVDGETGYLAQPGDAADLAGALERVLASAEHRAELGARLHAHAPALARERSIGEIEAIYDEVLGDPSFRPQPLAIDDDVLHACHRTLLEVDHHHRELHQLVEQHRLVRARGWRGVLRGAVKRALGRTT